MTIVVNVEESPLEQVTKQLNKLVEVIKVVELDREDVGQPRAAAGSRSSRGRQRTRGQVLEHRAAVPGQGRRRRHSDAITIQIVGNQRQAGGLPPGPGAVRRARAGAVRRWWPSAAVSRSITERNPLKPVRRPRAVRAPAETRLPTHLHHRSAPPTKEMPTVAEMFYDDHADLSVIQSQAASRSWGTAARGTRTRCRCGTRAWTCASGCPSPGRRVGARPRPRACVCVTPSEACRGGRPDRGPRPRPASSASSTPSPMEPNLVDGRRAVLRARLQHPLRLHRAAGRGRRRRSWWRRRDRATSSGASTSTGRGVPVLVAVENDATGKAWDARARLRQGHRRSACRRHQDHLHRGDRDRSVR